MPQARSPHLAAPALKGIDLALAQPLYTRLQHRPALLNELELRHGLRRVARPGLAMLGTSPLLRLLEQLHAEGEPHAFSWLAAQCDPATGHGVLYFLRSCTTLGDALDELMRLRDRVLPDGHFERTDQGDTVTLSARPAWQANRLGRQLLHEAWLVWLARTLTQCAGRPLGLRGAEVTSPDAGAATELEAMFGAPVRFGQPVGALHLPAAVLAWPLPGCNPALRAVLRAALDRLLPSATADTSTAARVRQWLGQLPTLADATQAGAAEALHCGTSSLRRRLADEGESFSDLVNRQRRRQAFAQVAYGERPIPSIADALGYADRASFERAFKGWFACRPAQMRLQLSECLPHVAGREAALRQPITRATAPGSEPAPSAEEPWLREQWLLGELATVMLVGDTPVANDASAAEDKQAVDRQATADERQALDRQAAAWSGLGALWLRRLRPEVHDALQQRGQAEELPELLMLERDAFGVDRFEAAALVLAAWQLPVDLIERLRGLSQALFEGRDPLANALAWSHALLRGLPDDVLARCERRLSAVLPGDRDATDISDFALSALDELSSRPLALDEWAPPVVSRVGGLY